MNSYMRQVSLSNEQVHCFLNDKQTWESAIAMYQGPDPLDHWYNYICWYEQNRHRDHENKFRETLERCLTLYEHADYYKCDLRIVRLWFKYIAMQQDPLHFYQVLHQRGVGKGLAAFYVGWANYLESVHALKDAENIYYIAHREDAQPHEELQQAFKENQLRQRYEKEQQQQQQLLAQQQAQLEVAQQAPASNYPHIVYQQSAPAANQYQQQQQYVQQQPQQQVEEQQQINYLQQFTETHAYAQPVHNHVAQPVVAAVPATAAAPSNECYTNHSSSSSGRTSSNGYGVYYQSNSVANAQTAAPAATPVTISTRTVATAISKPAEPINNNKHSQSKSTAPAIKLPAKFFSYSRNHHEPWTPAICLEEPADPSRCCHYKKTKVYPPGTDTEYSIEELRASKYLERLKRTIAAEPTATVPQAAAKVDDNANAAQYYALQQQQEQQQQQQQQQRVSKGAWHSNADGTCYYVAATGTSNNSHDKTAATAWQPQQQQEIKTSHNFDDLEQQIEATTIHYKTEQSQCWNKSIKIKFKKERKTDGSNGINNGSAYTIENVYADDYEQCNSPAAATAADQHSRKAMNFHPYTSTPKSHSIKSYKNKVKRVNNERFTYAHTAVINCSSSNSSSFENVGVGTVGAITPQTQTHTHNSMADINYENANYSFSDSMTAAVDRLNFRDANASVASNGGGGGANNQQHNNNNNSYAPDISTYQENSYFATQHDGEAKARRLQKALDTIARHMDKVHIDPFSSELCKAFLTKLDFPQHDIDAHAHYKIVQTPLPKVGNARQLTLPDGLCYSIDKEVGRGSYGWVYKASDLDTGDIVALKYQRPPNIWEIYICDQVLKRLEGTNVLPGVMDISTAIIAPNASLIVTEFSPFGSLLDINNKIRGATQKVMHESLVMHFSAQICNIVQHLHQIKIIHADIKPDNFLLMRIPNMDSNYPSLRLIDFGCAIDMTLFPEQNKTKFYKVIQTDGFTCVEMQEGRAWSYETDHFCIAGTVHVMLFGDYMQLQKQRGSNWDIKQKLPRYLKKQVWSKFFQDMLNIKDGKMPDLRKMMHTFDEETMKMESELQKQFRTLSNILYKR